MNATLRMTLLVVLTFTSTLFAQEDFPSPKPTKEHLWLKQLEGTWDAEFQMAGAPKDAETVRGIETFKMVGGYWAVSRGEAKLGELEITSAMTIGYDADKKQFVGTWIDSMFPHLWHYQGTLDETGKILTLESEGPCPGVPNKTAKFRDIIEMKSANHRTLTNRMQGDDGKWTTLGVTHYRKHQKDQKD